jgi:phospholipase A1/A2
MIDMPIGRYQGIVVTKPTHLESVCAALLLGINVQAYAAESLADCAALDADNARLACYDRLAGRGGRPEISAVPTSKPEVPDRSLLNEAWELEDKSELFHIRRYKPVYLMPVFHASQVNPSPHSPTRGVATLSGKPDHNEAKFQISFKTKVADDLIGDNGDLWIGYTQSSRWQVYNRDNSRPFRETNYEPEAMFVWRTNFDVLGMKARYASLGINHQSNGQGGAFSRSWNRATAAVGLERGDWTVTVRPWWRLPELGADDDNPDLADFAGRAELLVTRVFGAHVLSVEARHSLRGGEHAHGSVRLDWAFPIDERLKGHIQWFSGYAESLIDYNHRANYLGLGISLVEWH